MNIALKLQAQKAPNMLSSHRCWALDAMMMNFFPPLFFPFAHSTIFVSLPVCLA
jgi:hypothetical protein